MKDRFGSLLPNLRKAGAATRPENDLDEPEDKFNITTSTDAFTRTKRAFP